ncbi:MAG: asparagine synthase (glutamine-hydrolyzing) [Archangium sp.]|nr:asparagine synthase (glutamine-hydrolyzing) [Archangium sp.]
MCGVAGIVSFEVPPSRETLERMSLALAHRGPDDSGLFLDGPCGLAFRRLAVIDLVSGHQPMSALGATLVFNGEIYNHLELKHQLVARGHAFKTTSDTEVLLHAYLEWGAALTEHIDGMFAFAIWDSRTRTLHAARDRFGKKPFYYSLRGQTLLFASELKALRTHRACPSELDVQSLHHYLAFEYVPTPRTILRDVHKLEAGHQLTFDGRQLHARRYYALPQAPERSLNQRLTSWSPRAADDAAGELLGTLTDAVRRRLIADVPIGVFLSGGIDSAAIAALVARERPRPKTFTIAFDEAEFDESRYARDVAEALGTDHHELRLSPTACLDLVPQLAEQLDEPFADASYIPTFLLSRFTRQHTTVALSGDGADELFGGYATFAAHSAGEVAHRLPHRLAKAALDATSGLPASSGYLPFTFKLRTFLQGVGADDVVRHQAWLGSFQPHHLAGLLSPAFAPGDGGAKVYEPIRAFARERNERGLEQVLRFYCTFYLADDILTKVDRASMAASLEVRSPFLDTKVVENVFRLPLHHRLRPFSRKWLLKRALRGMLPPHILHRKKHGFALPVAYWLKDPLRELREDLLGEASLRSVGIFNPQRVRQLVADHDAGRYDHRKQLWTLMMFELWRRRWLRSSGVS